MEDNANTTFFTFDSPKEQSSYIKVIGVGGGGGNAVNHMFREGIEGVDFIVCNTDMKALNASPVPNKIPIGALGLGAGGRPEKGRKAAESKADDIREALSHNTQMLFITAGMGGGTGTGAAPVIADIAKSIELQNEENEHILVVAIVTRPFSFEGEERCQQAEEGIENLRGKVDSIIVINNDKLRSFGNLTKSNAFAMANDILLTAAKGIAEIITKEGSVNRDFQDVKTVMENSGTALMGIGCGAGDNRAHDAIEAATTSVLLDDSDINGAKNVLLYFSYSHEHEMTIDEMTEVTDYVSKVTGGKAKVLWGDSFDDSLGEELKVILIATGFDKGKKPVVSVEPNRIELPLEQEATHTEPKPEAKADEEGMMIIQRTSAEAGTATMAEAAVETAVETVLVPETIAKVETENAEAATGKKNIIPLIDDEIDIPVRPVRNIRAGAEEFKTEIDTMVEDIRIVQPEPEPAPEPEPEPMPFNTVKPEVEKPHSQFNNDIDALTAADRIRRIHDLLRNNTNGGDIVGHMKPQQAVEEEIYEGLPSSAREASTLSMRADGTIAKNPYLYGNQPD